MSATAKLLRDLGWSISGSDESYYPPVSTYLENHKIHFYKGYKKSNIPTNLDLIVIGKHARLIPKENEEVKAALNMNVPIKSFAQILGELSQNKNTIVVAGSYGKSTCAALLAWCLEKSGKKPSYFIGAVTKTPQENSKIGRGKIFILEGDEYPSSNWDNQSKFLHYHPKHLLLTSLAHDHINVFKTAKDYQKPFKKLIHLVPKRGTIVASSDGEGIKRAFKELNKKPIFYTATPQKKDKQWKAKNIVFGPTSSFDLFANNKKIVSLQTTLLGQHNLENIVGASALLLSARLISPKQLRSSILSFEAPYRRLDRKSVKTNIPIYEGFGSSYQKAKSAIGAMKLHFPLKKLIVFFEPYTFSWRSKKTINWYNDIFKRVDQIFVYKPPEFGSKTKNHLTLDEITKRIAKTNPGVIKEKKPKDALRFTKQNVDGNSAILFLSSGDFGDTMPEVIEWIEKKFPKK
ncbi:MAG: hypothetical protein HYW77_03330 [Parcubacteria group bacterium]|nr:hypothetical protein [Parcubacteria group bacterium]